MTIDRTNETVLAFLAQPVQAIAREGEGFATEVIAVLKRWRSERGEEVVREHRGGLFVLSPDPRTAWSVVILDGGLASSGRTEVCAVGFGSEFSDVRRFESLSRIKHFCPVMEVALGDLTPPIFGILAADEHTHGPARRERARGHDRGSRHAMLVALDEALHRRPSDMRPEAWHGLMDDARMGPLIVGDEPQDQFVLVARYHLQELLEPMGARALGRKYAARALDAGGLVGLPERVAAPLDDLPGIPVG